MTAACTVPACARPSYARGFCQGHYAAHLRGRPLVPLRDRDAPARERVSLRVSPECRERILARPADARLLLEGWAKRVG